MIDEKVLIGVMLKSREREHGTVASLIDWFIEVINKCPKVCEWIPCSERLPKDIEDNEYYPMCIVTLENGDVCLGVYRHDDKEWYTRMSEGEDVYSTRHKVLAWMYSPQPYKEE